MGLSEMFGKHKDDHGGFNLVENKLSNRQDLHAFLLLEKLCPFSHSKRIIGSPSDDEIYLSIDCDELEEAITDEQVLELVRCGIMYDEQYECLTMFA